MFLGKELWGADMMMCALDKPPWGAGFTKEQVAKAACLQIHFSGIADPGGDFTLFRLVDTSGGVLAESRVGGY